VLRARPKGTLFGSFFDVQNLMEVARQPNVRVGGSRTAAPGSSPAEPRRQLLGERRWVGPGRCPGDGAAKPEHGVALDLEEEQKPRENRAAHPGNGRLRYSADSTEKASKPTASKEEERQGGEGAR
jgi:hypothetical protein